MELLTDIQKSVSSMLPNFILVVLPQKEVNKIFFFYRSTFRCIFCSQWILNPCEFIDYLVEAIFLRHLMSCDRWASNTILYWQINHLYWWSQTVATRGNPFLSCRLQSFFLHNCNRVPPDDPLYSLGTLEYAVCVAKNRKSEETVLLI